MHRLPKAYSWVVRTCIVVVMLVLGACLLRPVRQGMVNNAPAATEETTQESLTELDAERPFFPGQPTLETEALPITALENEVFPREARDYTIMVYLVGSDLETNGGCATLDLQEMMGARYDRQHTNVVVYTGGSRRWHANIPNNRNCVLEIGDGDATVVAATDRSVNMGSTDTLAEFIVWAMLNYPAEHQALILWDHGAGPSGGCGFDQLYQYDSLSLVEMADAMSQAGFGPTHQLDWVGFDACLMNSMEIIQAWDDYAHYLVGSQDVEAGYGWDYSFLSTLDETTDADAITIAAVDSFRTFYETYASALNNPSVTLAAVDLSCTQGVEQALDELSDAILLDFQRGDFSGLSQARERCRSFGSSSTGIIMQSALVDLVDLADQLAIKHPDEAYAVRAAVEDAVISNATSMSGANGISLYFPADSNDTSVEPATAGYARMLEEYNLQGHATTEINWDLDPLGITGSLGGGIITVALEPGQMKGLSSASYTILADYEGRGYVPVMANVRIVPDEGGTLLLPDDPLVLVTTQDDGLIVPVEQIEDRPEREVYRCATASLLPGTEFVDAPYGAVDATVLLSLDLETNEVSVASASLVGEGGSVVEGRLGQELDHYKTLMFSYGGWQYPERAGDGQMLPWSEWDEQGGSLVWSEIALGEDLGFEVKHLSELMGSYCLQVVLTDITGNRHASELMPLESQHQQSVTVPTDLGELSFTCLDDHVVVASYRGRDERLVIPSEVQGLPVTEVGANALSNNWSIREIVLPDTVTTIGSKALNCPSLERISLGSGLVSIGSNTLCRCMSLTELTLPEGLVSIGRGSLRSLGITQLTLPASLERLGEGALTHCTKLTSYAVAPGCTAVQARDGVLFSADGTTLVAFPAGRGGSYEVPAGVQTIGYGAFAATALSAVSLPEGLTVIDNCAFCFAAYGEQTKLESVTLPQSLESMGAYAFGSTYNGRTFREVPVIQELSLGRELTYVGTHAFSALRVARFAVDDENAYFSSPGGFLANKMGDTILEAPSGMGQVIVIPESVTTLGKDVFALCEPGTDFVLPATLTRISLLAFPYHYEGNLSDADNARAYDVRFHCAKGTAAAEFAERHHIAWDTVTDVSELTAHEAQVQQGDVTLSFLVWPTHAVLHGIDATQATSGQALVIPDEVDGVPVTSIDSLQQSMGVPTTWESVTLPAALESLEPEAIPLLRSDMGFVLDEANPTFSVTDGVLFSDDHMTLVAFSLRDPDPSDVDAVFAYEVPSGTRSIGTGSFLQSQLERVVLPASVRNIQKRAFLRNASLVDVQLNEGLQRIDDYALECAATSIKLPESLTYLGDQALVLAGYDGFELPEKLRHVGTQLLCVNGVRLSLGTSTVQLGKKLTELGQAAFASADVTAFEVDPDNEMFSSVDGLLLTKDGRRLLRCPAGLSGELHLPEGILYLEPGCLEWASGLTDVYFPTSVMGADAYLTFGADSPCRTVTFHCKKGSAPARYAQAHGIAWTEDGV